MSDRLSGKKSRLPGHRRRRAGRAHRAMEDGRGRGRHAGADLSGERRDSGLRSPRQGGHLQGRQARGECRHERLRRARAARRRGQPGLPAHERGRGRVHPRLLRGGQAGGIDLPRPMDARRGRRRARAHRHLLAEPQDGHSERRRHVGGRGGARGVRARDEPEPRRPPGLLRRSSSKRSARAGTKSRPSRPREPAPSSNSAPLPHPPTRVEAPHSGASASFGKRHPG